MLEQKENSANTYKMAQRLSHVETQIAGIAATVGSLSSSLNSFTNEVRGDMRTILQQQQSSGKFQPGLLATCLGVGISAMVFYTNITLEPIREKLSLINEDIKLINEKREVEAFERGKNYARLELYTSGKIDK